jgi:hypothetical protein
MKSIKKSYNLKNIPNKEFEHDEELWLMWSSRLQVHQGRSGWGPASQSAREKGRRRNGEIAAQIRMQSDCSYWSARGANSPICDGRTSPRRPDKQQNLVLRRRTNLKTMFGWSHVFLFFPFLAIRPSGHPSAHLFSSHLILFHLISSQCEGSCCSVSSIHLHPLIVSSGLRKTDSKVEARI